MSINSSHSQYEEEETLQRLEDSIIERKKTLARAFVLDSNNEWVTVATGVTVSELSETGASLNVSLNDDIDPKIILFSTSFRKEQEIVRQQATVVTWTATDSSDVALSFENEEGCDIFWIDICNFLGRPIEYSVHEEIPDTETAMTEGPPSGRSSITITLPEEVEFNTILEIDEAIGAALVSSPEVKREICMSLVERSYVSRLLDLFRIAEDLDSRETLFRLYNIFKHLVLLNHPALLREILSDSNVIQVAGVFEYDPLYPDTRPGYRQFLLDRQKFKQILPLNNPQLIELIHQTFRTQYLKDVVLPRILDEETFGSLLFLIRCNFAEIVELIETEEEFIPKLLPLFNEESPMDQVQVLKFMKEFLSIAKSSANGRHLKLYQENAFNEFLQFLQRMLANDNGETRTLAIDVLIGVTQHDSNIIRSFVIESKKQPLEEQLLTVIINNVIDFETDIGLRWQLVAILRTLLDTAVTVGLMMPSDEFLNFFYPDYALRLLNPLVTLSASKAEAVKRLDEVDVYYNCCELLCSFIVQHKYRMKYLLFRSFIVHNTLFLLKAKPKVLQMSAIRLVRTMIGTGDDFYFRFLIKQNLFKPLLEAAMLSGTADNALSSALIELFYFIRDKRFRIVIGHLVETFRFELDKIQIASIAQELKICYSDLNDPNSTLSSEIDKNKGPDTRDTWSGIDKTEEAYFSSVEDEDGNEGNEGNDDDDEIPGNKPSSLPSTSNSNPNPIVSEVPQQMVTIWLPEDDLDRNKRMKY